MHTCYMKHHDTPERNEKGDQSLSPTLTIAFYASAGVSLQRLVMIALGGGTVLLAFFEISWLMKLSVVDTIRYDTRRP